MNLNWSEKKGIPQGLDTEDECDRERGGTEGMKESKGKWVELNRRKGKVRALLQWPPKHL